MSTAPTGATFAAAPQSAPRTSGLAPVPPSARIHAIDVVRGVALLGILLVNMQLFSDAFGTYIRTRPEGGLLDAAAFYFVKIFCEGKFYPLFSLLFGIGLTIQAQRARAAGRRFLGTGVRRLLFLLVLGLVHGLLLWYGDILFLYACAGVTLPFMAMARPRTQIITGTAFLLVAVALMSLFGLSAALAPESAPPAAPAATASDSTPQDPAAALDPFDRVWKGLGSGAINDPSDPVWIEAERQAYSHGPFSEIQKFRTLAWAFMVLLDLMGLWWHVAAMFLFGSALLKLRLFDEDRRPWQIRFLVLGAFVGLPICIAAALLPRYVPEQYAMVVGMPLLLIGGPMMSLGYLCGITLLVHSGRLRRSLALVANAGRMALTNYLTHTVVSTAIFYYWGLGLFGRVNDAQRILLVLAIFGCQLAISTLWLQRFRYGPMEWVWRSFTYLRAQPMRADRPNDLTGSASPAA
jgi:uncharacterized protein